MDRRDDDQVPEYDSYCPIAMGSEVVADRWTPMILRELILGSTRFNDIARGLPGISRSLLVQRLRHLERKGVLERWPSTNGRGGEYRLTAAGKDLEPVILALGEWSVRWLFSEIRPDDVDAVTLMWWMHRRVDRTAFAPGRVVVQFDHRAPRRMSIWLVLDQGEASVCLQHPGFDSDIVVACTTAVLAEVFGGLRSWSAAVDDGLIDVDGPRALVRALPRWFLWSPFAPSVRNVAAGMAATV